MAYFNHRRTPSSRLARWAVGALGLLLLSGFIAGCGGGNEDSGTEGARRGAGERGSGERGGGAPWAAGARGDRAPAAAVPVEVLPAGRREISSFFETNSTLEAENEVDLVARIAGPITRLAVEEGDLVSRGQLLALIDDREAQARAEVSRVAHQEAQLAFQRSEKLFEGGLISSEEYEQARSLVETTAAQLEEDQLQVGYTRLTAPFAGRIVVRYVDFAQQVNVGDAVFRLSDFTPLLAPIQVPERELPRIAPGQSAYLQLESFPGERFSAQVQRIRPVVDSATGTVRVTLEVDGQGKLRPGMFARVFLRTETRADALVVPKAALSLESLGDTVYVVAEGVAQRRDVELGFREGDAVEILSGLEEGEAVVVVGQQSLSDGAPVQVLGGDADTSPSRASAGNTPAGMAGPESTNGAAQTGDWQPSPDQLERIKARMRERGLSEEQIEERLRQGPPRGGPPGGRSAGSRSGDGGGQP